MTLEVDELKKSVKASPDMGSKIEFVAAANCPVDGAEVKSLKAVSLTDSENHINSSLNNSDEEGRKELEELRSRVEVLVTEKKKLGRVAAEKTQLINSLEAQKVAMEAKLNYLQKQVMDFENQKNKLFAQSSQEQTELQKAKDQVLVLERRMTLLTDDLSISKRKLSEAQIEANLAKNERDKTLATWSLEKKQMATQHSASLDRFTSEKQLLQGTIDSLNEEVKSLEDKLQKVTSEDRPLTFTTADSPLTRPRRSSSISEQSVAVLRAECEKLALENAKLKAASPLEYIRNVVLRYLQLPDQRPMLLSILAEVLKFTDEERSTIKK